MDELDDLSLVASMTIDDDAREVMASAAPSGSCDAPEEHSNSNDVCADEKENEGRQRRGPEARSCAYDDMLVADQPHNQVVQHDTHLLSSANGSPPDEAAGTAGQLSPVLVRQRATELFPAGATVPAIKPRLPPTFETPTSELATLVFGASKHVKLTRGVLAREEAAGYITADLLGIELLTTEALPLGESVRKAAIALEKAEKAEKNGASAKKSRLRQAAAKDADRAAQLDEELRKLDETTEVALTKLRQAPIKLSGLPDRKTKIVTRRAPEPTPVDHRQLSLEKMFGSQEAMNAIDAADDCERAERDYLEAEWGYEDEFGEPLDKVVIEEELELARLRYKHALRRLKAAFPSTLNDCSPEGKCEHRRPCPCGQGQRGAWPWVIQTPARGFCEITAQQRGEFTPRGLLSCYELSEERERWRWALAWGSEEHRDAMRMPDGERQMPERRFRELYEEFRRELYAVSADPGILV